MAVAQKQIDPAVRDALASIEWDAGNLARLTCGQLDRKLYTKVNDVLESLGGKWSRKAKAHLFEGNAQDQLEAAIETGVYISGPDLKQIFGEFETPDELADEVAARLKMKEGVNFILEPSAGSGQLIKAMSRQYPAHWINCHAVEIQQKHYASLSSWSSCVVINDFLSIQDAIGGLGSFHYVAMNPPFARQADIDHVRHAWNFLAPGGRLVAIMSPGFTFRTNQKSVQFKDFVEEHGDWKLNPEGSFTCSGTNVNTVMVALEK
jgi:hypothetical protein